jgi:ABC-2 type transport system permease protein
MSQQKLPSVVKQLVLKDWELHRYFIAATIVFGGAALALLLLKREPVTVVGSTTMLITLIVIGCLLPASNILNERKKQSLPFVMSLPISSVEYTTSKLLSTIGMYLIAWLTLVVATLWLIIGAGVLPLGVIPMALILLTLPLIGLSLITGMTMVGETEGWNLVANMVCNPSYGFVWYFITRTPSLMHDLTGNVPVWNSAVIRFLVSEYALIAVILALTYYLQARKTDFV